MPNGLILQWGLTGNIGAAAQVTISYPIPFPNQVFSVTATPGLTTGGRGDKRDAWTVKNLTQTKFDLVNDFELNSNVYYWVAIGY